MAGHWQINGGASPAAARSRHVMARQQYRASECSYCPSAPPVTLRRAPKTTLKIRGPSAASRAVAILGTAKSHADPCGAVSSSRHRRIATISPALASSQALFQGWLSSSKSSDWEGCLRDPYLALEEMRLL